MFHVVSFAVLIEHLSYSSKDTNEQAVEFDSSSKESSIFADNTEERSQEGVFVDIDENASGQA